MDFGVGKELERMGMTRDCPCHVTQRHTFFQPYNGTLLPEVCSHGLEHVVLHYEDGCVHSFSSFWNTVQKGRYSYCASPDGNMVKFVVADYLAVEVCINMAV